ncbi:hypothetical protein BD769DRAFT_1500774 [Suillus cothurnatus]|nr:hypothetical protein BD769DRAFT_1500774 [Suillus cothurnatus]
MATFRYHKPTSFDTSPSTHTFAPHGARSLHHPIDPDIALYTPSKRMRLMNAAVSRTASGSFLVSKDPVTSAHQIAQPVLEAPLKILAPNWALLHAKPSKMSRIELEGYTEDLQDSLSSAKTHLQSRDLIIEGAHAQLIVQGLLCAKQSQSLYAQEMKKKTDRAKLFLEGKGRHLTDESFTQELERVEQEKQGKEAKKDKQKASRAAKRSEKASIEAEWCKLQEKHIDDVAKWVAVCKELGAKNVPKKNWPKKPVRPLKPKRAPGPREIPVALSSAVTLEDTAQDNENRVRGFRRRV